MTDLQQAKRTAWNQAHLTEAQVKQALVADYQAVFTGNLDKLTRKERALVYAKLRAHPVSLKA